MTWALGLARSMLLEAHGHRLARWPACSTVLPDLYRWAARRLRKLHTVRRAGTSLFGITGHASRPRVAGGRLKALSHQRACDPALPMMININPPLRRTRILLRYGFVHEKPGCQTADRVSLIG